jgi:hypothetical protein
LTYKALNRVIAHSDITMTKTTKKEKIPLVSESEYRKAKAICNKFERTWRSKHPKEHKENSKELLTAIAKNKQPKKVVKKEN